MKSTGTESPYSAGKEWEDRFKDEAERRGYTVTRTKHNCPYDLLCNGWRVQCKSTSFVDTTCGPQGRIRISRGSSCRAGNNYASGDFDVFAILFDMSTYLVPVEAVGSRKGQMRRRLAINKMLKFKDNWAVFDGAGVHFAGSQMELF